jgi:hypothetical protein
MINVAVVSEMLKPFDARLMRCYPVSTQINHVANDDAECSAPVELIESQADLDKLHAAYLTGQELNSKRYQINVDRMPVLRRQQLLFVGKVPWPGDNDYRRFNIALTAENGSFSTMLRLKHL